MGDVYSGFYNNFPKLMQDVNSLLPKAAQAQLAADQAVSPGYAKLTADLYKEFAPEIAKTDANIDDITQKAGLDRQLSMAKGSGAELVTQADLLQKQLDPEYYTGKEQLSGAISKYLAAMDPTMTENELEAIRRGMGGDTGNNNSEWDRARNEFKFGKAAQDKAALFGDAIRNVSSALPAMRSGISGVDTATRTGTVTNSAPAKAGQAVTGSGSNMFDLAQNILSGGTALQNTRMGKQVSGMDNTAKGFSMTGNLIGGIAGGLACWVAREIYPDRRWQMFREYLLLRAPRLFRQLYLEEGERFATFIRNKPFLKIIVKLFMDSKLRGY
jgi:hypothetical protein